MTKSKLHRIIIIFFATLTVLQCESVYDSSGIGELFINALWQITLFLIGFKYLNNIIYNRVNTEYVNRLIWFILCYVPIVFVLLIFYYLYSPFTLFYFFLILVDPVMLVICFVGSARETISKYFFYKVEDIILVLAVISFIFWLLETNGLSPNMSTTIKWGGMHNIQGFDYIQFIPQNGTISFLGKALIRNSGIFVEATIYAFLLCIALIIELFMKRNPSKIKIFILFITICSTTSTTGLIVSLLAIFYYMFITINSSYKFIFLLLIPIIFLIVRFIFLNKVHSAGSSYGERTLEWHIDMIDWKQHLLIGNGLPSLGSNGSNHSFGAIGLSSGLMASLAYGGIIFSLYYVLPSLCSLFVSKKMLGISILCFILFTYTIIMNFYMYTVILSYLWTVTILKSYPLEERNLLKKVNSNGR